MAQHPESLSIRAKHAVQAFKENASVLVSPHIEWSKVRKIVTITLVIALLGLAACSPIITVSAENNTDNTPIVATEVIVAAPTGEQLSAIDFQYSIRCSQVGQDRLAPVHFAGKTIVALRGHGGGVVFPQTVEAARGAVDVDVFACTDDEGRDINDDGDLESMVQMWARDIVLDQP